MAHPWLCPLPLSNPGCDRQGLRSWLRSGIRIVSFSDQRSFLWFPRRSQTWDLIALRSPAPLRLSAAQQLDFIQALNRRHEDSFGKEPVLDSRIQAMETAYRMQLEAMDVSDLHKEPAAVREEYGSTSYVNGCLLARRLVEHGVRCVSIYYGNGQPWDDHKEIRDKLTHRCRRHGPGVRGLDSGSEAARPAGRDPSSSGEENSYGRWRTRDRGGV